MTAYPESAARFARETAARRDEVLAEVVAWLTKKAREYRANGETVQADAASVLASKVARGAVRPDNLRMLPADFFEPSHTYRWHDIWTFQCVAIDTHPETGARTAVGWWRTGDGPWQVHEYTDVHWSVHWADVTEGGRAQHYDKVPDPADGCHWCACGNRWPCKHAGAVTA
jgi:hypothetical protein